MSRPLRPSQRFPAAPLPAAALRRLVQALGSAGCGALLLGTVPAAVQAQQAEAGDSLEPVVITASPRAQRLVDAPYAIGVVGSESLRAAGPMINLSEAMAQVPGLVVANRNNYAQDLQISSRGFGARAGFGVRGLRLYTDGIPATMPDGQGQVGHFDLAGAERIEVLRGPFSALYGNSSGGVIAVFSQPVRQASAEAGLDLGSHGLRQLRLGAAAPLGEGFEIATSVQAMALDGLRPQSEASRGLFNLRLGWRGEHDRVTLLASHQRQRADDPLGLSRAQFDADPDSTTPQAESFDTRKTIDQTQAGASWVHRFGSSGLVQSQLAAYAGERHPVQYLAIAAGTQANARHGGGIIDFTRRYGGVEGRLLWRFADQVDLVTGLNLETQRDDRQGYENYTGTPAAPVYGVQGTLRRDELNRAETREAFAQADWRFAPDWQASLGLRGGALEVSVEDRYLSNGDDSGERTFRYTNPVAGLRWSPSPQLTLHASAARGYESPTLGELAYPASTTSAGFNTTLQAQTSRQVELGAKWRSGALALDAALFHIRTDDEIGIAFNQGGRASYQNVGRTQREGAEFAGSWRITPAWRGLVSLTLLRATYEDDFLTCAGIPCTAPNTPVPAGNRVAGTQRASAYAELAWTPGFLAGGEAAVEWRGQGRTAVNDTNSDFAAGWGIVNLRWRQRFELTAQDRLELLARVDNLTDKRYVGSVIVGDANGRYFEPAAGRSLLASLRYRRLF
ncbi:MAG: TonB-dependent receptor [Burkholderiaceae bacterium]|nr:TonB-dependent receptor [Burkholderiaceae bacterium]